MPSLKQKVAFEKTLEFRGNVTKAMKAAGYSLATVNNPSDLTKSKGWQELKEQYLPDNFLMEALREDIEKKPQNRKPELELAFKVTGRLYEAGENKVMIQNIVYLPAKPNTDVETN